MSVSVRSSGVVGMACHGRLVVQGGRSNAVVMRNQRYFISEERNKYWLHWKSEGFIVPFEDERQQNDNRGKELYFVHAGRREEDGDDCVMLETSKFHKGTVRKLQRQLYLKAKHQSAYRFYSLYDKIYRSDVLQLAYNLVKQNKGSPGLDGETFDAIETGMEKLVYLPVWKGAHA